jgi:ribose transport system substrate-binding protein
MAEHLPQRGNVIEIRGLDGNKDIPHDLVVPDLEIDQAHLAEGVANTPVGSVANKEYSLQDAKAAIAANVKK